MQRLGGWDNFFGAVAAHYTVVRTVVEKVLLKVSAIFWPAATVKLLCCPVGKPNIPIGCQQKLLHDHTDYPVQTGRQDGDPIGLHRQILCSISSDLEGCLHFYFVRTTTPFSISATVLSMRMCTSEAYITGSMSSEQKSVEIKNFAQLITSDFFVSRLIVV